MSEFGPRGEQARSIASDLFEVDLQQEDAHEGEEAGADKPDDEENDGEASGEPARSEGEESPEDDFSSGEEFYDIVDGDLVPVNSWNGTEKKPLSETLEGEDLERHQEAMEAILNGADSYEFSIRYEPLDTDEYDYYTKITYVRVSPTRVKILHEPDPQPKEKKKEEEEEEGEEKDLLPDEDDWLDDDLFDDDTYEDSKHIPDIEFNAVALLDPDNTKLNYFSLTDGPQFNNGHSPTLKSSEASEPYEPYWKTLTSSDKPMRPAYNTTTSTIEFKPSDVQPEDSITSQYDSMMESLGTAAQTAKKPKKPRAQAGQQTLATASQLNPTAVKSPSTPQSTIESKGLVVATSTFSSSEQISPPGTKQPMKPNTTISKSGIASVAKLGPSRPGSAGSESTLTSHQPEEGSPLASQRPKTEATATEIATASDSIKRPSGPPTGPEGSGGGYQPKPEQDNPGNDPFEIKPKNPNPAPEQTSIKAKEITPTKPDQLAAKPKESSPSATPEAPQIKTNTEATVGVSEISPDTEDGPPAVEEADETMNPARDKASAQVLQAGASVQIRQPVKQVVKQKSAQAAPAAVQPARAEQSATTAKEQSLRQEVPKPEAREQQEQVVTEVKTKATTAPIRTSHHEAQAAVSHRATTAPERTVTTHDDATKARTEQPAHEVKREEVAASERTTQPARSAVKRHHQVAEAVATAPIREMQRASHRAETHAASTTEHVSPTTTEAATRSHTNAAERTQIAPAERTQVAASASAEQESAQSAEAHRSESRQTENRAADSARQAEPARHTTAISAESTIRHAEPAAHRAESPLQHAEPAAYAARSSESAAQSAATPAAAESHIAASATETIAPLVAPAEQRREEAPAAHTVETHTDQTTSSRTTTSGARATSTAQHTAPAPAAFADWATDFGATAPARATSAAAQNATHTTAHAPAHAETFGGSAGTTSASPIHFATSAAAPATAPAADDTPGLDISFDITPREHRATTGRRRQTRTATA